MPTPRTLVASSIAALALAAPIALAAGGTATAKPDSATPSEISLPSIERGEAALRALGSLLPDVARLHGYAPEDLAALFRRDAHLAVDRGGRLFYEDQVELPDEGEPAASFDAAMLAGPIPLEETFRLHSRPGARRTLYLDFDGHVLSGTAWNNTYNGGADIICPPYDFEGGSATFTASELTRIQNVWRRVAEDFAPFEVDVTTEYMGEAAITRGGSTDGVYGMRVLISPISSHFGNYGGIAYIGAFDDTVNTYKPALVFPERLAQADKYIGEAASHEAGHTLGLTHDGASGGVEYYQGHGSGETGWAPIMGNGYGRNLTQWSRGEYAGANNAQDDMTIIAGFLGFRADDHGDASGSATYLPAGPSLSVTGFVGPSSDVDVFGFSTGPGSIDLSAVHSELGPDLDIFMELRAASGALVATANLADALAADSTVTVPAGSYFLNVRGTGKGDPLATGYTDYASIGAYTISGSIVDAAGRIPPVASAGATPTSGPVPLTVQLNGAASFDPDGTVVSYDWDFGDGGSASVSSPTHVYASPGSYTATLTVLDYDGLSGADTVTVSALPANLQPTASALALPHSGYAPFTVTLDGSGSSDPDGTLVSYHWSFGDGSSTSGAIVQHTYATVGLRTAVLTVTDDAGGSDTASTSIDVRQDPGRVVRVASIQLALVSVPGGKQVRATLQMTDPAGAPVGATSVSGSFSGAVGGGTSGTTDASGNAVLTSKKFKKRGTVTFTVTGASKPTYAYDPALNLETSDSIAAAPTP